jgi:hypothetical protein
MNLQEAIEFLDNQGYYLIKETHAEDDTLDWLGQVVYEYTQENGIKWHSDWRRGDGYKLVYRNIYEFYTVFDDVGEVKITIKNGEITEIEPKKGGIYSPEEFAEKFGI